MRFSVRKEARDFTENRGEVNSGGTKIPRICPTCRVRSTNLFFAPHPRIRTGLTVKMQSRRGGSLRGPREREVSDSVRVRAGKKADRTTTVEIGNRESRVLCPWLWKKYNVCNNSTIGLNKRETPG
jgi:hypothetical protein